MTLALSPPKWGGRSTRAGMVRLIGVNMATAIPALTRIQDQHDASVTPGAGTDSYALTWDNASGKFVLTAHVTATDPHTGYVLPGGACEWTDALWWHRRQ